jgi:serine/threonine protein kinase
MSAQVDPFEIVGSRVGDRYDVETVVGETTLSVVYRASHAVWKRPVAIKAFKVAAAGPEAQAELLASFIREGALLAELSERSTAICQARDVGSLTTSQGQWVPYLVLEWIDGEGLDAMLERERQAGIQPRDIRAAIALLSPIAEALAIAHARGIAHCDVKPGNVLVLRDARDTRSHAKLLDFGMAHVMRGSSQDGGVTASFTPGYAAPEQWSSKYGPTGPRTDVFALALMVVEVLTGGDALQGDQVAELAKRACDPLRRPTPRTLGFDVGERVERVLLRALALQPEDRFATARDLWDELATAAAADDPSDPLLECPPDLDRLVGARRRRTPIAAATCVLLVCAVLAWQFLPQSLGLAGSLVDGSGARSSSNIVSAMGWVAPRGLFDHARLVATVSFVASAVWLGTLFSVSWLCGRATLMADAQEIGRLSVSLFRRWTLPSLVLSLVAGALWCGSAAHETQRTHWLYGVLLAGVALVGLTAAVGHQAGRLVGGSLEGAKGEGGRRLALLVSVWATIAIAIFRSALVP